MDHQPGQTHEALPLDPENDIDAGKALWWFLGSSFVLFACLWILVPIFVQVQDFEIDRKVNQAPTTELDEMRAKAALFLKGDNPTKKNIDKAMESYVKSLQPK